MKAKTTRRALVMGLLSMGLSASMLVGTTFAWFTDSVASSNNLIKSGNLDVELYYQTEGQTNWTKVDENTNVFMENALWEPGHTEVVKLKVVNEGSLALKYQLGVNIASEIGSKNVLGNEFELSDYIKYAIVDGAQDYADRNAAVAAVDATSTSLKTVYEASAKLLPQDGDASTNDESVVTMVVYMPTSVGNEANCAKDEKIPTINLGINLFATQATYEKDSFDDQYDANNAVFTVEEANQLLEEGAGDVTLAACNAANATLEVPASFAHTLTVIDSTLKSVQAAGDLDLVVLGDVVVNAKDATSRAVADGSAITANGKLSISGNGHLTAIAADANSAFGIGGLNVASISIKDVTIDYVSGGYAYGVGSDTKYYKDAPEGGSAIGSGLNGAEITLDNVTVEKAIGGSKSAGIGARYHVGATVNISNSIIKYVEGGVSAAGIGSSRVSNGATENGTTINIVKSTVTAKGGVYGAGIGSGYDTHCQAKQPLCTINVTDSAINATGGKYAAGVGTGYHNAALAGEIKNSTVTAVSGEKVYKDTYTSAMDIGFGVTDPAREGQQTDSKLVFNGVTITIPVV